MKQEKGLTLTSLIIYIILMTFIIGAIAIITSSFRDTVQTADASSESAVAFSKFNMYFIKDIKREGITIEEYYNDYIILSYPNQEENKTINIEYSMQNNALYRNKVKICDNVNNMTITVDNNNITINLQIKDYNKTTTYTIESV